MNIETAFCGSSWVCRLSLTNLIKSTGSVCSQLTPLGYLNWNAGLQPTTCFLPVWMVGKLKCTTFTLRFKATFHVWNARIENANRQWIIFLFINIRSYYPLKLKKKKCKSNLMLKRISFWFLFLDYFNSSMIHPIFIFILFLFTFFFYNRETFYDPVLTTLHMYPNLEVLITLQ